MEKFILENSNETIVKYGNVKAATIIDGNVVVEPGFLYSGAKGEEFTIDNMHVVSFRVLADGVALTYDSNIVGEIKLYLTESGLTAKMSLCSDDLDLNVDTINFPMPSGLSDEEEAIFRLLALSKCCEEVTYPNKEE